MCDAPCKVGQSGRCRLKAATQDLNTLNARAHAGQCCLRRMVAEAAKAGAARCKCLANKSGSCTFNTGKDQLQTCPLYAHMHTPLSRPFPFRRVQNKALSCLFPTYPADAIAAKTVTGDKRQESSRLWSVAR